MASCIAVAEYPGRIEKVFLNKGKSAAGVYSVQFYALNVPITITVDDYLPVDTNNEKSTWFASIG